jgi:chromosome segregation ATPase
VNDIKVTRQALNHNDVVRCGSLWLRYVEEGGIGMTSAGVPGPMPGRTVASPAADFGFASTVATPRSSGAPPAMTQGGMSPMESTSFGGGRNVVVDMGDSGASMRYRQQSEELRMQLDTIRAERDKEVAENKRLRAEMANVQARLDDAKTQQKEAEEVIQAHKRLAEDLRGEAEMLKDRDHRITTQMTEAQEDLASRNRQLQRAQEDITKIKQEIDGFKKQVAELSRQKDEGFKKLNEQLAEVEHLREVIREQERMLEERRVGIISLEEAVKELRQDREGRIKEMAQLKAERDEIRIGFNRQVAQMAATDEENRRLGRLMEEFQGGSAGADKQEVMRLSAELKALRFENKRLDSEVDRLETSLRAAEKSVDKMQADFVRLQEGGSGEAEQLRTAERERGRAEEARIKAESAKARVEEEKAALARERDELSGELEKLQARIRELEERPTASSARAYDPKADRRVQDLQKHLEEAEQRSEEAVRRRNEVEERLRHLEARGGGGGAGGGDPALREKAGEIYQSVNDVLAELRVNLNVVKDEFATYAGKTSDARSRTIRDAIEAAAGQTEDVKGVLRALRELAEA